MFIKTFFNLEKELMLKKMIIFHRLKLVAETLST